MATDREKRLEITSEFVKELASVADAFRWVVDSDGQIRGRLIACTRIQPFSPLCAVALCDDGYWDWSDEFAGASRLGMKLVWKEIKVASDTRNNTMLRRQILDAVGLKGER